VAKLTEIRKLLLGGLDPARARDLTDDMRAAGFARSTEHYCEPV